MRILLICEQTLTNRHWAKPKFINPKRYPSSKYYNYKTANHEQGKMIDTFANLIFSNYSRKKLSSVYLYRANSYSIT